MLRMRQDEQKGKHTLKLVLIRIDGRAPEPDRSDVDDDNLLAEVERGLEIVASSTLEQPR
jgi:hypothetical protein